MQTRILFLSFLFFFTATAFAQTEEWKTGKSKDRNYSFVSTSLWSIANLFPNPADFYQLDYGCRFVSKNVFVFRAITWKYNHPLGIPLWSSSFESDDEEYPGYVRAFGFGVGYQRYLWKGLFAGAYATPFLQYYNNKDKTRINSGFQFFLQVQAGYHINLFSSRFFFEPSVTCNYWPVNTKMPESFKQVEKNWSNYYIFEPHFNIGYKF
jgi:hypothetical protein